MGSDVSHFNVSLTVRDKVTRQRPQTTTSEEKGEPKRIRTEVPLLTSLTAGPNRLTRVIGMLPSTPHNSDINPFTAPACTFPAVSV